MSFVVNSRVGVLTGLLLLLALHALLSSQRNVRRLYDNISTMSSSQSFSVSSTSSNTFKNRYISAQHDKEDNDQQLNDDHPPLWIANPKQDAFAACLMVMDDNHRLAEWLPYHYLTMPLRHVVVLVDDKSTTSPAAIFKKWEPYMTFEVWNMTTDLPAVPHINGPPEFQAVLGYIKRQGIFLHACATHLQRQGWSWTSFHDVDEYYVARKLPEINATDKEDDDTSVMGQPGIVLDTIRQVQTRLANGTLPSNEHYEGECVTTYRILFGVNESSAADVRQDVPTDVIEDPQRFETLRFRYFAKIPQIGKSLFNVQHFPANVTNGTQVGAHRLVYTCEHPYFYAKTEHYLRLHHYLGSWESYNSRPGDPRVNNKALEQTKSAAKWRIEGAADQGPNDVTRPWLSAFVQHFGKQRSQHLLADVGVIVSRNGNSGNNHTAALEQARAKRKKPCRQRKVNSSMFHCDEAR